ncbi:MAG: hypothetical protein RLZZ165_2201 [Bacteroidota bacterium]
MKKGLLIVAGYLLGVGFSPLSAQLHIGPAIQGGMTYSKNIIIPDTSQYHIGNLPGLFGAMGLDFAYLLDKNVRIQAGIQGQYRAFNLKAPDGATNLSFTNIKKSAILVSVPLTINYRFPLGSSNTRFFNVIAGHALDYNFADSTVVKNPGTKIDSGGAFVHHFYEIPKYKFPVSTVLLGVGMDMVTGNGNLLNLSLVWGISTRTLFRGSVQEWEVIHQDYDPATATADPEEFPDHYYEWALRGSNISVRAAYYFNLKAAKERKESKLEDEGEKDNVSEKPRNKEKDDKGEKRDIDPKPAKEKKPVRDKEAEEEEE